MSNAADLQENLTSAVRGIRGGLVVDCSDLTFIDSSGLNALARTQRALAEQGRHLRMVNASPIVRRICDATGLTHVFRLADAEPAETEASA